MYIGAEYTRGETTLLWGCLLAHVNKSSIWFNCAFYDRIVLLPFYSISVLYILGVNNSSLVFDFLLIVGVPSNVCLLCPTAS